MSALFALLLAHLLADFLFQSGRMVAGRAAGRPGAYLSHASILAVLVFLATYIFGLIPAALAVCWMIATHVPLDILKDHLWRRRSAGAELVFFLADQALHMAAVFAIWRGLRFAPDPAVIAVYQGLFHGPVILTGGFSPQTNRAVERMLLTVLAAVGVTFGGAPLIGRFLGAIRVEPGAGQAADAPDRARTGRYIGLLERGLILILVLAGHVSAVGFVVAAKSVARFSELNDKRFAEYYLVGTLASTLLALGVGLWLRSLGGP